MRTLRFASLTALLLSIPSVALAGGCPTCTTSADCTSFDDGGVAFCVEWNRDFGCGTLRIACCPGQGCNTFDGRPSCEASGDCVVVDEDAGTPTPDSGTTSPDAGTTSPDGGSTSPDAGTITPMMDGGTTPMVDGGSDPMDDGGCGCRAPGRMPAGPAAPLILAALALTLTLRRR